MSISEAVGLLATAALLAAVTAIGVHGLLAKRRRRIDERWIRRRDSYVKWLGGQMTLCRASLSLVAAFRALARESRDSRNFALRIEEAQRARQFWCEAMSELDRAEAGLLVWSDDSAAQSWVSELGRVTPAVMRRAINGDESGVRELREMLEMRVESARGLLQRALREEVGGRAVLAEAVKRSAEYARTIMDRWSQA